MSNVALQSFHVLTEQSSPERSACQHAGTWVWHVLSGILLGSMCENNAEVPVKARGSCVSSHLKDRLSFLQSDSLQGARDYMRVSRVLHKLIRLWSDWSKWKGEQGTSRARMLQLWQIQNLINSKISLKLVWKYNKLAKITVVFCMFEK